MANLAIFCLRFETMKWISGVDKGIVPWWKPKVDTFTMMLSTKRLVYAHVKIEKKETYSNIRTSWI